MARRTGVIYDLPMNEDCDGVHIEYCDGCDALDSLGDEE